jgi:hypothetical protein
MSGTEESGFIYRASGVGVGGRITDPPHGDIPAQASAALPPDGGRAEARVSGYNFEGILDVAAAYTVITGNPGLKDGQPIHRTVTTTTVEGLNVRGVVTANTVVAQLISEQPAGSGDLRMRPVGHFTNLRIKGVQLDPKPHQGLLSSELKSEIDRFLKDLYDPYRAESLASRTEPSPQYLCSLFDDNSIKDPLKGVPGVEVSAGGTIHVKDFGTIYVGQFLVEAKSRRLTMLRIVLGSPPSGPLNFCSVEGNGSPPP